MYKLKVAVLLDVSRAFERDLLLVITRYNKLHNKFNFFFYSPKYIHEEDATNLIQRVIAWQPDGILTREIGGLQSLLALDIPLIILPYHRLYARLVNIWGNNSSIGEMAARYFMAKGFKNYAFLGIENFQWSEERRAGFEAIVRQEGFDVTPFIFDNDNLMWEDLPPMLANWLAKLSIAHNKLKFIGKFPSRGTTPRDISIDPTGKWLIAANQDSNTIAVFSIDTLTGKLCFKHICHVSTPSCICWQIPKLPT